MQGRGEPGRAPSNWPSCGSLRDPCGGRRSLGRPGANAPEGRLTGGAREIHSRPVRGGARYYIGPASKDEVVRAIADHGAKVVAQLTVPNGERACLAYCRGWLKVDSLRADARQHPTGPRSPARCRDDTCRGCCSTRSVTPSHAGGPGTARRCSCDTTRPQAGRSLVQRRGSKA
jgi:hypothetical protein